MFARSLTMLLSGLLLAVLLNGCASVDKRLDAGDYDRVIELTTRRLAGKNSKNPDLVKALEEAFARATERDMKMAERLRNNNNPEEWPKINDIYRRVRRRQEAIEPLLPLVDKHGYKAEFRFVRVEGLENESREKAAAYHYDRARDLLDRAERGDKAAAREAYSELNRTGEYYKDYRDVADLKRRAHDLGTSYVLVKVENRANVVLPAGFEAELRRITVSDLNDTWREYHLQPAPGADYDYRAVISITNIGVSPESVKEREYVDEAEIQDGFDYVLDERGNVKKDSLGNDIRVPRKVKIKAWVIETLQQKVATVSGRLELYDMGRDQLLDSQDLTVDAVFENYASTFRGDERALSKESRGRIGNRPRPFPSDEALILEAADRLKPVIKSKLERTTRLI